MAFIINSKGEKVSVAMEVDVFSQAVVLYEDTAQLKDCYILNLYRGKFNGDGELVAQVQFLDCEPTKKIMHEMWKHGLSRFDVATIEKGYILDWE